MPSPFPGMDPFLENTNFSGLHSRLIYVIDAMLQKRLPRAYYADINERCWVDCINGIPHDERRETFIEIMTREGEEERIVTAIEIISMANKTPGETGRDLYLKKQREIIGSGRINLVEIDLLRAGKHSTAIPREWLVKKASPFDYHVCIHQFDRFEDYFVYAILMHEKLPEIAIPLLPDDGSVAIDLQQAMNLAYDDGPYAKRVRYELSRISPALSTEQEKWASEILSSTRSKL